MRKPQSASVRQASILDALSRSRSGLTVRDISEAVGIGYCATVTYLKRLRADGAVVREARASQYGDRFSYRLPPSAVPSPSELP